MRCSRVWLCPTSGVIFGLFFFSFLYRSVECFFSAYFDCFYGVCLGGFLKEFAYENIFMSFFLSFFLSFFPSRIVSLSQSLFGHILLVFTLPLLKHFCRFHSVFSDTLHLWTRSLFGDISCRFHDYNVSLNMF